MGVRIPVRLIAVVRMVAVVTMMVFLGLRLRTHSKEDIERLFALVQAGGGCWAKGTVKQTHTLHIQHSNEP